jgi:hypothetical protein
MLQEFVSSKEPPLDCNSWIGQDPRSHYPDFNALSRVGFPYKIVRMPVDLPGAAIQRSGLLYNSLSQLAPHWKELCIRKGKSRHVRMQVPASPDVQQSLSAPSGIEHLVLYGCNDVLQGPVLQPCTGCNDIFTNYFVGTTYHQLKSLRIASMYISGSRLQRFIKNHAITLTQVELERMVLIDGTWRSIAQGLAKIPHLNAIFSYGQLYQKRSATLVIQMSADVSVPPSISLNGHAQIQQFLLAWLEHFHTTPCPPSTWGRTLLPQSHEVFFVKPDNLYMDRDTSTWRKRKTPRVNPYKKSAK